MRPPAPQGRVVVQDLLVVGARFAAHQLTQQLADDGCKRRMRWWVQGWVGRRTGGQVSERARVGRFCGRTCGRVGGAGFASELYDSGGLR